LLNHIPPAPASAAHAAAAVHTTATVAEIPRLRMFIPDFSPLLVPRARILHLVAVLVLEQLQLIPRPRHVHAPDNRASGSRPVGEPRAPQNVLWSPPSVANELPSGLNATA